MAKRAVGTSPSTGMSLQELTCYVHRRRRLWWRGRGPGGDRARADRGGAHRGRRPPGRSADQPGRPALRASLGGVDRDRRLVPATARPGPGVLPADPAADPVRRLPSRAQPRGGVGEQPQRPSPRCFGRVPDDLLRPARGQGLLTVPLRHRPVAADSDHDRVLAVRFEDTGTGGERTVTPACVLDATEQGDLLPLAGWSSWSARSRAERVSPTRWTAGRPGSPAGHHVFAARTACPARTTRSTGRRATTGDHRADLRSGPQRGWASPERTPLPRPTPVWRAASRIGFRRILYAGHYGERLPDVTLVNWLQATTAAPLVGRPGGQRADALARGPGAEPSSVPLAPDGGPPAGRRPGYPGLRLRPECRDRGRAGGAP